MAEKILFLLSFRLSRTSFEFVQKSTRLEKRFEESFECHFNFVSAYVSSTAEKDSLLIHTLK